MLKSDLCDFSDVYIVVTRDITVSKKAFTANDFVDPNNTDAIVTATNNANTKKNIAPSINCISKINGTKMAMQKT